MNKDNTDDPPLPKHRLSIHLTGFGEFAGVSVNPTMLIIRHLIDNAVSYRSSDETREWYNSIESMNILEVSMEGVKEYFDQLDKQALIGGQDSDDDEVVLLLHLGVNASAREFDIEKIGVNEATFRAADQRGNRPYKEAVSTEISSSITHSLQTAIDVDALAHVLNEEMKNVTVAQLTKILATKDPLGDQCDNTHIEKLREKRNTEQRIVQSSTNAGRFLCNYIYYRSLVYAQLRSSERVRILSLFVHVPSQQTIELREQVSFCEHLLSKLYKQLASV